MRNKEGRRSLRKRRLMAFLRRGESSRNGPLSADPLEGSAREDQRSLRLALRCCQTGKRQITHLRISRSNRLLSLRLPWLSILHSLDSKRPALQSQIISSIGHQRAAAPLNRARQNLWATSWPPALFFAPPPARILLKLPHSSGARIASLLREEATGILRRLQLASTTTN